MFEGIKFACMRVCGVCVCAYVCVVAFVAPVLAELGEPTAEAAASCLPPVATKLGNCAVRNKFLYTVNLTVRPRCPTGPTRRSAAGQLDWQLDWQLDMRTQHRTHAQCAAKCTRRAAYD